MCQININELEAKINNSTKDEFLLELEGTINEVIKISNMKILIDTDYIKIYSQDKEKMKLNKHQIMRIEGKSGEYIISFDSMQKAKIK